MLTVAQETVAVATPKIDTLELRLLALRSEIDTILAGLSRTASAIDEGEISSDKAAEEPAVVPAKQSAGERAATDDLTLVRGIDDQLSDELNSLGIVGYAQVAGWSAQDVADVEQALGLRRVISKENWIEQAAILASGKTTAYAGPVSDYPLAYGAEVETSEADVFMLERIGRAPMVTARQERRQALFDEISPESKEIVQGAGVPSLDPYRGVPTRAFTKRRASIVGSRGRGALGVKVAACLIALIVAGLAMVGRDAWGSVHLPTRKKAALPLQVHKSAGLEESREQQAAWAAVELDRFKAAYRK
jgi:predicted flap endonuclease-1-like 5' DNA nuclease